MVVAPLPRCRTPQSAGGELYLGQLVLLAHPQPVVSGTFKCTDEQAAPLFTSLLQLQQLCSAEEPPAVGFTGHNPEDA